MWKFVSVFLYLLATGSSLPLTTDTDIITSRNEEVPTLATELLPPREDAEVANFGVDLIAKNSSPSTELLPPIEGTLHKGVVFLINLFSIKNQTGESTNEIFTDEVIKNTPALIEPVATVLLVLEEDDEEKPVNLDELAKDLEEEGFKVDKIVENGDTKVIKVDFDGSIENPNVELIKNGKINRIRRKRSPHGLLAKLLNKGKGDGGGCQGGCGGGSYGGKHQGGGCGGGTVGVIPIYVVSMPGGGGGHPPIQYNNPVHQYHPPPQYVEPPQYHPPLHNQPPQYYPPQQLHYSQPPKHSSGGQCDVCSGNHGSRSHSSAQASAQSSSDSW